MLNMILQFVSVTIVQLCLTCFYLAVLFVNLNHVESSVRYRWHMGDYESLHLHLQNIDWYNVLYHNPSASNGWAAFKSLLWLDIECYVPRHPVWKTKHRKPVPRHIAKCTVKKRNLWRKLKANPCNSATHMRYRECVGAYNSRVEVLKNKKLRLNNILLAQVILGHSNC